MNYTRIVTCKGIVEENHSISIELGQPDAYGVAAGKIVSSTLTETLDDLDENDELVHPSQATYAGAMHGIEAFILAMACQGVDIESDLVGIALETAIEACINNLE